MVDNSQKLISLANLEAYHNNLKNYILGICGDADGTSAGFESELTNIDWSTVNSGVTVDKNHYYFKVCSYSREHKHMNMDLYFRICVNGEYTRVACNIQYPHGSDIRAQLVPERIFFESDNAKGTIVNWRLKQMTTEDTNVRELWMVVEAAENYSVSEAYVFGLVRAGEIIDTTLEAKPYGAYSFTGDSLNLTMENFANKTTIGNISSHATGEYAAVFGKGCKAGGTASIAGGLSSETSENYGVALGEKCKTVAYAATTFGSTNTNAGNYSLVGGSKNTNKASVSFISGTNNLNLGSNAAIFGHTNKNNGQHSLLHGYSNYNGGNDITNDQGEVTGQEKGFDYVTLLGTQLKSGCRLQSVFGAWNKIDSAALAVWGNGTSESARKNVFTIGANGPRADVGTDGVTIAFLNDKLATFTPPAQTTIIAGTGCTNTGANSIVVGNVNTNKGSTSAVFGNNNNNTATHSLLSGNNNTNIGSNSVMVGHTNTNSGQHVFIHGYENHNDTKGTDGKYFDYVDMHGTQLKANRRCQMLRGQWNKEDNRALAIWANGSSDTARKNVFTIAANGTPTEKTDGVTLGYLEEAFLGGEW